jgi:hypothetical protein
MAESIEITRDHGTAPLSCGAQLESPTSPPVRTTRSRYWRRLAPPLAGIILIVAGVLSWCALNFSSPGDAVLYLKGARLIIEPATVSLGQGRAGEELAGTFTARNLSSKPIMIMGASTTCDCVATEGLPVSIRARGSRVLRPRLHLEGKPPQHIVQEITYLTSSPREPAIRVRIKAEIRWWHSTRNRPIPSLRLFRSDSVHLLSIVSTHEGD